MLATNDVGRRMSEMSGRSSQDTGELPFFGKKNETTVAELSLAAITQSATPKASGAAASPMDGPQDGIVALTTLSRPKSSHTSPAGSASGSRYHAAPRHKPDSNRERVYAPTAEGAASKTTIEPTAEVQALSEQVIVVPKGGVMSKLRAAGAADAAAANALRKGRRSKSSKSAMNKSEHRNERSISSTKAAENHTSKPVGAKHSDTVSVKNKHAIASAPANDSVTTQHGLNNLASLATQDSRREPVHSVNDRHNRAVRNKAYRRKRGKKTATKGVPSRKHSTAHDSSLHSYTSHKRPHRSTSSREPRGHNVQLSDTLISLELRRKRSTKTPGSEDEEVDSTPPTHSRTWPSTFSSQNEVTSSLPNTATEGTYEKFSSVGSSGRHDSSLELVNLSTITVGMVVSAEGHGFTYVPSYDYSISSFSAANSTYESARRAIHTFSDNMQDMSPQSTDESKRENTQVGGGYEHSTVRGGSDAANSTQNGSAASGIKEIERGASGVVGLNTKTSRVSTVSVETFEAQNRKLLEGLQTEMTAERVSADDWWPSLLGYDALINKESAASANDTVSVEEKKYIDFTNERHEDDDIDPTDGKSDFRTANSDHELDHRLREVSKTSSLSSETPNFVSSVTSELRSSSMTEGYTTESQAHSYTESLPKEKNLVYHQSTVESSVVAIGKTNKNEIMTVSPPQLEVRKISTSTDAPEAELTAFTATFIYASENGNLVDAMSKTPQKPVENTLEDGYASLVQLEVNFASRRKETNKTKAPTADVVPSFQTIFEKSSRKPSTESTQQNQGYASHSSPSIIWSSGRKMRPVSEDKEAAHPILVHVITSTSSATNDTLDISLAGGNTAGLAQTTALNAENDDEDDDEESDDETRASTTSQTKTSLNALTPRTGLNRTVTTTETRKSSTRKPAAPVMGKRTSIFNVFQTTHLNLTFRTSDATKRIKVNAISRLSVTNKAGGIFPIGSVMTLMPNQSFDASKNPYTMNNSTRVAGTDLKSDKKLNNATLTAPTQRPSSIRLPAVPSQSIVMRESTTTTATPRSRKGDENNSSVKVNDNGSIWRRIFPPQNASSLVTKMTAPTDSGAGVENYYDDSRNETSSSGSGEVDDSHGEPKTRNRRIFGEIRITSKSSKKPDMFQTEYYYDDTPSRKREEPTTDDITEPGYESIPAQEAIDDLFS
ncbi:hypothetical protein HPB51_005660 [Rhipicephalus microplus]|uniref:Uncharacterized protein n=1 Tax=Rhipicephalus microplus TaxID=6941 RepID=A0A9J6EY42_RHIMP|nr:hypothetical protein HPB51_005660 [Rhipicephalus microplus]